jgi:hypothetical protein
MARGDHLSLVSLYADGAPSLWSSSLPWLRVLPSIWVYGVLAVYLARDVPRLVSTVSLPYTMGSFVLFL